ncbi:MAG: biopolymer transporter ExbD [Bacteroidales bacterium]|jgi:biopolymer transport protein ExbD|nr:biopolymer transporter ExbD [Bacteroidales bacterium]
MAKFRKDVSKETPEIATTSLPDIIFMLIFFFMVTTSMRQSTVMVEQKLPIASEVKKLENKSLVSYIYIGTPQKSHQTKYGTATRIQLNDHFAVADEIAAFIASERETHSDLDQTKMTTALKIDENVRMGQVTDVKQALRRVGALKISYTTLKGDKVF